MGARYLTDLADLLRADPWPVVELDGWQTRARSSGGYDGAPWVVMWHHTASNGDGADDAHYCTFGDEDAPLCNIVIGRDGTRYICAAGATNCNGKGGPLTLPDGRVVPADGMNPRAVAIEISNGGAGMSYPAVQLDACFATSNAITAAYIGAPDMIAQHVDWAPDRKIDPATAIATLGTWHPSSVNSSGSWALADLRGEAWYRAVPPPPTPIEEVDTVEVVEIRPTDADAVFLAYRVHQPPMYFILWCEWCNGADPAQLARLTAYRDCAIPVHSMSVTEMGNITLIGPVPAGDGRHTWTGDEFGNVI